MAVERIHAGFRAVWLMSAEREQWMQTNARQRKSEESSTTFDGCGFYIFLGGCRALKTLTMAGFFELLPLSGLLSFAP